MFVVPTSHLRLKFSVWDPTAHLRLKFSVCLSQRLRVLTGTLSSSSETTGFYKGLTGALRAHQELTKAHWGTKLLLLTVAQ